MNEHVKCDNLLIGLNAIIIYTGISKGTFYTLLKHKFPAYPLNGTWYAHKENIDNYFKQITSKPPEKIPEGTIDA
jgi:hypothetical protein